MPITGPRDHKIEPEFLGPLGDRPLAETARDSSPDDLFPGASAFLSPRQQRTRREQWNAARPLAARLLRPEEHILYVTHGMQMPPVLHLVAMGYMALAYHQVVLVFTESRVIEVLLNTRAKKPESRVRSYPYSAVRSGKLGFGKLTLVPSNGKKAAWKIPLRGDVKLLKLLLPKLQTRFLSEGAGAAQRLPLWHCPQCAAAIAENPRSCAACKTSFRSTSLASLLSLAFPGAGLLYAGHPFLALGDFVGEVVFYALFLIMMLEDPNGSVVAAAGIGAILFTLTKLESLHLSRILVARSKPETESRRAGYRRFALVGGLASLILIGGAFPLAGAARKAVDRDLELAGAGDGWNCSREGADWVSFADDPSARLQCQHESGATVTVFAYAQGVLDGANDFRAETRREFQSQGMTLAKDDEDIPSPFHGFRIVSRSHNKDGDPVSVINYFVMDEANHDVHQVLAAAVEEEGEAMEQMVREMISGAQWVPAGPARTHVAAVAGGK